MRTDCSVGGEPLPNDIPNNVSQEEVSENQLSLKSNNTNESESSGRKRKKNSSAANDAKCNCARNKHPLHDPCSNDCKLHCILKISHSPDLGNFLEPLIQQKENVCFSVHNQAAY